MRDEITKMLAEVVEERKRGKRGRKMKREQDSKERT